MPSGHTSKIETAAAAPQPGAASRRGPLRTALVCASIVAVMVALSFAAVPLYDLFCRTTGFGGTTQRAETGASTRRRRGTA